MNETKSKKEFGIMESIEDAISMKAGDYKKLKEEYIAWQKHSTFIPTSILTVLSFIMLLIADFSHGYVQQVFIVLTCIFFYKLIFRYAHKEGYIAGYESGQEEGVYKAHHMTESDIEFFHEIQMEKSKDEILKNHSDRSK